MKPRAVCFCHYHFTVLKSDNEVKGSHIVVICQSIVNNSLSSFFFTLMGLCLQNQNHCIISLGTRTLNPQESIYSCPPAGFQTKLLCTTTSHMLLTITKNVSLKNSHVGFTFQTCKPVNL